MGSLRPDVGRLIAFPASGREPWQTKRQLAAHLQVSAEDGRTLDGGRDAMSPGRPGPDDPLPGSRVRDLAQG